MPRPPLSSENSENSLPRAFHVFWAGQSLSALGDAMTLVALPLLVLAETGSIAQMGRLTALARVSALLATGAAGFVVDRRSPRRVMLLCDLLRCALMALIPMAWGLGLHSLWLVYLVGVGAALFQGLFYVGHVSLVAELVGVARVGLANSRIEGTIALAYVFGPFLAGLLASHWGVATVLAIDSATFLASALSLAFMAAAARATPEAAPPSSRASAGLAGLKFLRKDPELLRLTGLVALGQLFTAAIVDLFIFRLKHDLGQGDAGTGLTFAIASAAAVLAAIFTPWLRARISFHRIWVSAFVLQGLALIASSPSQSFALLAVGAALYMAAMTTTMICQASIRQERTPQHLLGRVTSSYLVLVALPAPVGALLATTLAARFGARLVQAGAGAGLLLTAILAALVWARMPKEEPG
jgi:MFS family permease